MFMNDALASIFRINVMTRISDEILVTHVGKGSPDLSTCICIPSNACGQWRIQGGCIGCICTPLQKFKKNDFLAIFEGFWTIKQFLYALHY